MKFLVLWQIELTTVSQEVARAVSRMPEYGARLETEGSVLMRYHVVGAHGGAWIYEVDSHEQFERLLARSPVFNFATYTVHALADMQPELGEPGTTTPGTSEGGLPDPGAPRIGG